MSIFGFRGASSIDDLAKAEAPHPYTVTGHVGYSLDGGKAVYGFGQKVPDNMSAYDIPTLELLGNPWKGL